MSIKVLKEFKFISLNQKKGNRVVKIKKVNTGADRDIIINYLEIK